MNDRDDVVVVLGAGAIGSAIARRQNRGRILALADADGAHLDRLSEDLSAQGHLVIADTIDVSSPDAVAGYARATAQLGNITQVVFACGVPPDHPVARTILAVNLKGAGLVLESFGGVIAPGGAGVLVSGVADSRSARLSIDQEHQLADCWAEELLRLPFTDPDEITDPQVAYGIAIRAAQTLVRAAAARWGVRRARINSISAGILSTAVLRWRLSVAAGEPARAVTNYCGTGRMGTPDDVAAAAAFLLGDEASFITGADIVVDGGVAAAVCSGQLNPHATRRG